MSKVNGVIVITDLLSGKNSGKTLKVSDLSDGEYAGTWSGYEASAVVDAMLCAFMTVDGSRGIGEGCVVKIEGGKATVRHVPAVDLETMPHIW